MSPRGCLLTIAVFVVIVIGVLWIALPPVVGGLAVGALTNAGFHGNDTRVEVNADPPLRLLLLEADRIRIRSSNADIRNVHADSIDVTLRDVSIGARRFGFIEGTLSGVLVTPDQGPAFSAQSVQITGPAEAARVAIGVDRTSIRNLVTSAVASRGITVSDLTLAAPDRVTVVTPRGSLAGRLQVNSAGELELATSQAGTFSLVGTGSGQPVRLDSVQVTPDGVELSGTANVTAQ